jgi:8-amino-7-oxononanoate synthase
MDSSTPIQPLLLGSSAAALQAQAELLEAGFRVVAIRAPTVAKGSERLRITLSAAHTEEQVDALVGRLADWSSGLGQIRLPRSDKRMVLPNE